MNVSDITLEQALQILQLPRTVGTDPETGEEIVAANGRFGPFMKRGSETRSLETEDQLFTVTIEEALFLFAAPKQRRYGTSAAPLRELGVDPESAAAVVLRSGRFGPYVTDGTTNASLRRGDDPDELTLERAVELIADRRAAGPAKRSTARKATGVAKKAGARKATGTKKAGARKATGAAKKAGARKATGTKKAGTAKAGARRAPGSAIRTANSGPASAADDDW
jgi:DNA topoisomerase-1